MEVDSELDTLVLFAYGLNVDVKVAPCRGISKTKTARYYRLTSMKDRVRVSSLLFPKLVYSPELYGESERLVPRPKRLIIVLLPTHTTLMGRQDLTSRSHRCRKPIIRITSIATQHAEVKGCFRRRLCVFRQARTEIGESTGRVEF